MCNIYGAGKDCDGDDCGNCKFGYGGKRCQECLDGLFVVNNVTEGVVDEITREGATCCKIII